MSVKGWVYIITNESLQGLVKIGYTLKDPKLRAKELQSSGIPNDYKVAYEVLTITPREVEQKVHLSLKEYRDNKEWFKCSISQAVKTIRSIVQENKLYEKFYCEHQEREKKHISLEDYLKGKR
ncbi:MAG: GIY-YIG nuclease family protein [Candidatus Electrothrix sp. EH2]|nr:GIY-YIG nuclease family protein [Candidatus Electrothrix sp. EH2]